jgi:hypothetical protein
MHLEAPHLPPLLAVRATLILANGGGGASAGRGGDGGAKEMHL